MANPMEQFKVETLQPLHVAGYDVSFTNSSAWMLVALAMISIFLFVGTARPQLVPGRWQATVEVMYGFAAKMMDDNVGPEGRRFVPLVFSVFIFVLACNIMGLIPWIGAFTPTSHISVTIGLALIVFVTVCIVGFMRHGLHFFSLFWPHGVHPAMGVFVCVLEFLSFLSRPFTLAIRLFANMTAGHVVLKVFGSFVVALGVFGALPLVAVGALTALELLVALLQAYVFAMLTSLYLNDAINLH